MLRLLGVPAWHPPDSKYGAVGGQAPLPASLPACLLIYLVCHGRWVERDVLATAFWPERPPEEARHNLRVNLHRMRRLLFGMGCEHALQTERNRVWLQLPSDVDALRRAINAADGAALGAFEPAQWLAGFRVPKFEGFFQWAEALGAELATAWVVAAGSAAKAGREYAPQPDWLETLQSRLSAAGTTGDGTADSQDSSLVGRGSVLQTLRQIQFRAVVITGEAGLGKTSLLVSAFAQAPMLHGREGLTEIPYLPIVEFLQAHLSGLRTRLRDANDDLGAYRLDLARLLPQLAPREPLPPLDMHTAKARLLEALARVFEGWNPWLLIDDLQWCDGATLEFLGLLTHRGAVRWRAGARDHELSERQRDWLLGLERSGHLHQLALPGLDANAVATLCHRLRPDHAWKSDQLQSLHRQCAGNPFALQELLKSDFYADVQALAANPPVSLRDMLQRQLEALPPAARSLVEAAAVLVRPMSLAVIAQVADLPADQQLRVARLAVQSNLLREDGAGLQCRHDLVRHAVLHSLTPSHRQALHRRAALALAARPEGDDEPLAVAGHWASALESQTALAWLFRGADQLKRRGRFDEARSLWSRVAQESLDATQALQARLALAECEMFADLASGRKALELILEQAPAVAEPLQREYIEAQALSGLVDNLVFAGDMPAARQCAARLRPLLPNLRIENRIHASEVLIELAMREPDIAGAWALLDQVRRLAPGSPSTLSFEGQIHWFAGNVLAARDAFEALLSGHPDYCSGLTIENDLAVMLHAAGDLIRAEIMARRSLVSWSGVAHTEALSLLVLGSILTSAGRHTEAFATLNRAHQLGLDQGSALFVAEAQVRRAKLLMQCGQFEAAMQDLDRADATLHDSTDPLRVSQYAVVRLDCQIALGQLPECGLVQRVQALTRRSGHPLMLARLARMESTLALVSGDKDVALSAARRQADIARPAGLLEPLADALLLLASASQSIDERVRLMREAAALAEAQGFADMAWRALTGLVLMDDASDAGASLNLRTAVAQLVGAAQPSEFDAARAQQREPWLG